jgi:hypothetical protein
MLVTDTLSVTINSVTDEASVTNKEIDLISFARTGNNVAEGFSLPVWRPPFDNLRTRKGIFYNKRKRV